jgi:hypothetical protein
MVPQIIIRLSILALLAGSATPCSAASPEDAKAALAKAETAEKEAAGVRNRWTTAEQELSKAKAAIAAGNFDEAVKAAQKAEALSKASVEQANEQKKLWTEAVIR